MLIQIKMQVINSGRLIFLFLYLLLPLIRGQNLASKLFVADQVILWQGNSITQYQQIATGYTFTSTFANAPPSINKIYACVNGYNILNQNTLSFTIEAFLNSTTNGAYQIDFNPQGSTIIYSISFSIIATTSFSTSYITLQRQYVQPSILSNGLRPLGSNSQTFTFNGDIIFTNANYQIRNFISYMNCYQNTGIVGVNIDSMSLYSVGSHTFTVNLQVESGAQLSLCVIVSLFINKAALSNFYAMFAADNYQVNRNYLALADSSLASVTSTDFSTYAVFGPTKSRNCTIGLYTMKLDVILSQKSLLFTFNSASSITISSQIAGSGQLTKYQVFCLIDCQPTAFYNSAINRCDYCNIHIPDCYSCLSVTNCIDCGVNAFFDQLLNTCRCKFGEKVKGGCTTIHDCYQIGSSGLCEKCITGFTLSQGGNKCSCPANNFLVNDYCLSFPGCLTAKLVSGVPVCIACRMKQHYIFQTVNDRCVCEQGYAMVNGFCLNICGNGKTVGSEQCDDGNTISGDGCSNCVVQRSYICNNSLGVTSICTYEADYAEITLIQTYRDNDQNAGIFVFEVQPAISNLNKMNFASSISLSTSSSLISKSQIDYNDGILVIKIYFNNDLERHKVRLILNFDQKIFKHKSIQADFYVKSMNSPMLLFKKFPQYNFVVLSLKILSVLAIIIFCIGSWAHKMIGIQTIHIFQFIFFMSIYEVSFDDLFISSLQNLKYTSNYPDFFYDEMASIKEGDIFQSLTFAASFIGNYYIIGTLLILIFIGLLVMNMRKKFQKDELTTQQEKAQLDEKYAQMQEKIYSISLFPLIVGYYLQCFFAVQAQTYRKSIYFTHMEYLINAFLIMIFVWVSAAAIFKQIFFNLRTNSKAYYYNVPNRYIAFYLFNILINLIFFNFSDRFQYDITSFTVWNFVYFTIIAIYRPYQNNIHNFHILFNQVVYIYWFIILIYQDRAKVKLTDDQKYTALTVLISLLALSLLLGLVRSIFEIVNKGPQRDKITNYFEAQKEIRNNLRVKGIGKLEKVLNEDANKLKKYRLKDQARAKRHENRSYINAARNAIGLHNLFPSPKNAEKASPEQAYVSRSHSRSLDQQRLDKQYQQRDMKQIAAAKEIEQIKTKLRENLLRYKQRLKQEQF